MEKRYLFYEKTKRIGRIALASLLLVEPLISAYGNEKTKEFKNQMSNSIKVERMGDKMGSLKTVTAAEQAVKQAGKDIDAFLKASDMETKIKYFNEINKKRENKEYDAAYKQAWNELSKDKQEIFNKKWNEVVKIIKQAGKDIDAFLKASDMETKIKYFNEINKKRENKEYDAAYKQAWNELGQEEQGMFSKKWNEVVVEKIGKEKTEGGIKVQNMAIEDFTDFTKAINSGKMVKALEIYDEIVKNKKDPNTKGYTKLIEEMMSKADEKTQNVYKRFEEWRNGGRFGAFKSLVEKVDEINKTGTGSHSTQTFTEKERADIENYINVLKLFYENLTFSIDEEESKLEISYRMIDKKTEKETVDGIKAILDWVGLKKYGFTNAEIVGSETGESDHVSGSIYMRVYGPNKEAVIAIRRIDQTSREIVFYRSSDKETERSLQAEFKGLTTEQVDRMASLLATFANKKINVYFFGSLEQGTFTTLISSTEIDKYGNKNLSSWKLSGDPQQFLAGYYRLVNDTTFITQNRDRILFYRTGLIMRELFDNNKYFAYQTGITRDSIANIEYQTGYLTVGIGGNLYKYTGHEKIKLPSGDSIMFSGIQMKTTKEAEIRMYVVGMIFDKEGKPVKNVELPIYETTKLSLSKTVTEGEETKTEEYTFDIRVEPSKDLLEAIKWNTYSYQLDINNRIVGVLTPSNEYNNNITTMIDNTEYNIKIKDIYNKAIIESSKPDLFATIEITDKKTDAKTIQEIRLNELYNLSIGDKKIDIKIDSPKWDALSFRVNEEITSEGVVKTDRLNDDWNNTTITGKTQIRISYLEKIFGLTTVTGQMTFLDETDQQPRHKIKKLDDEISKTTDPDKKELLQEKINRIMTGEVMTSDLHILTAANLVVENEKTGEGFGIQSINTDPYLKRGIFNSGDDLTQFWIKKRVPILSWLALTGASGFSRTFKEVDETNKKTKIREFKEGLAGSMLTELPQVLSGEIVTKFTNIHQALIEDKVAKGTSYEIFYENLDWNKPGLWLLKFDYKRMILGPRKEGENVHIDNIFLHSNTAYTTKDLFDIFRLASVRWEHTKISNETEVDPTTLTSDTEKNIFGLILEGNKKWIKVYGGKERISETSEGKQQKENTKAANTIVGLMGDIRQEIGKGEVGIKGNAELIKSDKYKTTEKYAPYIVETSTITSKSKNLWLEPWYSGGPFKLSLLYGLQMTKKTTKEEGKEPKIERNAEQTRGMKIYYRNLMTYATLQTDNSSIIKRGSQKLLTLGLRYSGENNWFEFNYNNGQGIYSFNLLWRIKF